MALNTAQKNVRSRMVSQLQMYDLVYVFSSDRNIPSWYYISYVIPNGSEINKGDSSCFRYLQNDNFYNPKIKNQYVLDIQDQSDNWLLAWADSETELPKHFKGLVPKMFVMWGDWNGYLTSDGKPVYAFAHPYNLAKPEASRDEAVLKTRSLGNMGHIY